jgi:acyl-CoA synthetase (AMP-forming)/AMP-acid ligase II
VNVASHLGRLAAAEPDRAALIAPDGAQITWAELEQRSAALAGGLRKRLSVGDRVLVLVPMSIELYVVLLALFRARLTVVLLDPSAPTVSENLQRVRLSAFIGSGKAHLLRLKLPVLRGLDLYVSTEFCPLPHKRLDRLTGPPLGPEDVSLDFPALLTFTTGSTGTPKTVARTHVFLDAQRRILGGHMGLSADDVDLPTLPVFLLNSLAAGATCVLPDADLRAVAQVDPARIVAQLRHHRCTSTSGSPAFYAPIAEHLLQRGETVDTLRKLFTGGARVPPDLLERLVQVFPNARIEVVYGSTEAEPIATIRADEVLRETAQGEARGLGSCVGHPVPELALRVSPPDGHHPLPDGNIGELLVAGDHVNPGYFEDPDADAANKVRADGRLWHRTGDTGYVDEQGRIWLVGRVSSMVGALHPFQIEGRAQSIPWVIQAALVEVDGAAVLAVVLSDAPSGDWQAQLAQRLGVDVVAELPELPVDPRHNAKIDRRSLRALLASRIDT